MLYQFPKPTLKINTLVIGSGPTGLATSYLLQQNGVSHFLLEKEDFVAPSWRRLWKNYHLAMPANQIEIPGEDLASLYGPDRHLSRDEIIDFFRQYASKHQLPIRYHCEVLYVEKNEIGRFYVSTNQFNYLCKNLVCCIGPRQEPWFPLEAMPLFKIPELLVKHSSEYQSCAEFQLSDNILVIGSGLSALSITLDIYNHGHSVSLACGYDDDEICRRNSHLYGSNVKKTIIPTLRDLQALGVENHGRFEGVNEERILFFKDNQQSALPLNQFKVIVFATGYQSAKSKLAKMLRGMGGSNGCNYIPGLYIGGIPAPGQSTVIISDGTRAAESIVASIVAKERTTPVDSFNLMTRARL